MAGDGFNAWMRDIVGHGRLKDIANCDAGFGRIGLSPQNAGLRSFADFVLGYKTRVELVSHCTYTQHRYSQVGFA